MRQNDRRGEGVSGLRNREQTLAMWNRRLHLHAKQDVRYLFDLVLVLLFASIH